MKQVVIAFETTGNNPKEGHRFSVIYAIEQVNGWPEDRLAIRFKTAETPNEKTFAEQFDELDEFIGGSPIVVRHAGQWRKFLRPELANIKKRGANRLLKQTQCISEWAHQRFPKQRKDLKSIARRLQLDVSPGLHGPDLEGEQMRLIATKMQPVAVVAGLPTATSPKISASIESERTTLGFRERISLCWKVLTGKA